MEKDCGQQGWFIGKIVELISAKPDQIIKNVQGLYTYACTSSCSSWVTTIPTLFGDPLPGGQTKKEDYLYNYYFVLDQFE